MKLYRWANTRPYANAQYYFSIWYFRNRRGAINETCLVVFSLSNNHDNEYIVTHCCISMHRCPKQHDWDETTTPQDNVFTKTGNCHVFVATLFFTLTQKAYKKIFKCFIKQAGGMGILLNNNLWLAVDSLKISFWEKSQNNAI